MNEKLAYKWARQSLKSVEKADILEPHKYQQIANKIVAAILDAYKSGCNEELLKRNNIVTMTDEQKYKLRKAIELINDSINNFQRTKPKNIAIYLSVAGDYCKEIAKEIGNNESDD